MDYDNLTIIRHLRSIVRVQNLYAWVPHTLIDINKNQCPSLLATFSVLTNRRTKSGLRTHKVVRCLVE